MWVVYCHRSIATKKCYVGITSYSMEKRWEQHVGDALVGSECYFHRAIRKHGVDAWTHEILETVETKSEATFVERYWVCMFNSFVDGYNMTPGGDGVVEMRPETKELHKQRTKEGTLAAYQRPDVKQRHLEAVNRPETRKRNSEAQKVAQNSTEARKHRVKKSKDLIARSKNRERGLRLHQNQEFKTLHKSACVKSANKNPKITRAVQQLSSENGEIIATYASASEASRKTGYSRSAICHCARGVYKCMYGFHWRYV